MKRQEQKRRLLLYLVRTKVTHGKNTEMDDETEKITDVTTRKGEWQWLWHK